jgi:nicotinamide-nucleotide amidase
MKHLLEHALLPWLRNYMGTPSTIKTRVLRTAGIGESQIDSRIGDMMTSSNPTVGLAAHSGQVDIRITAKAETEGEAEQLINPIEEELRRRVGSWIYGGEKETIEQIIIDLLKQRNMTLSVIEMGTSETVRQRLQAVRDSAAVLASMREGSSLDASRNKWSASTTLDDVARMAAEAELKAGQANSLAVVIQSEDNHPLPRGTAIAVVSPTATRVRSFGWSADRTDITIWATTHAFAMLRRALISAPEP